MSCRNLPALPIQIFCIFLTYQTVGCGPTSQSDNQNQSFTRNVFGTDDRQDLDVRTFPGSAVARLDYGCSAAMIGRRLALTAAQCVYDSGKNDLRPSVKYLKVGYRAGSAVAESWISKVWIGTLTPGEDRTQDWAVLALSDDLGDKTGWFGIGKQVSPEMLPLTVHLAGYAVDKDDGQQPVVVDYCYMHKIDESGRILHDCDSLKWIAGGPLYTRTGSDADIVGISVSEFRRGEAESVHAETYSDEYANVAVNSKAFYEVVAILSQISDPGTYSQAIGEASEFINLNSSPGRSGGI